MPLAPANLVPVPRFTGTNATTQWVGKGTIEIKTGAKLDGTDARRLATGTSTTRGESETIILASDPRIVPGAALSLFIRYSAYNNGGQPTVSITPFTSLGPVPSKAATANLPYSTPYTNATIPLTLPAWPESEVVSVEGAWGFEEYRRSEIIGYRLGINSGPTAAVWVGFSYTRVDVADSPVTGYFDGDTARTEDYSYAWEGATGVSASRGTSLAPLPPDPVDPPPVDPVDPPPTDPTEPVPAPGEDPLAARVAAHIGRAGHAPTIAQASAHLLTVRAYVWEYTRGRGFTGKLISAPVPTVEAVIVSACTRLTANPSQVASYTAGDYSERGAILQGFTLPELAVLNNYRRRTA